MTLLCYLAINNVLGLATRAINSGAYGKLGCHRTCTWGGVYGTMIRPFGTRNNVRTVYEYGRPHYGDCRRGIRYIRGLGLNCILVRAISRFIEGCYTSFFKDRNNCGIIVWRSNFRLTRTYGVNIRLDNTTTYVRGLGNSGLVTITYRGVLGTYSRLSLLGKCGLITSSKGGEQGRTRTCGRRRGRCCTGGYRVITGPSIYCDCGTNGRRKRDRTWGRVASLIGDGNLSNKTIGTMLFLSSRSKGMKLKGTCCRKRRSLGGSCNRRLPGNSHERGPYGNNVSVRCRGDCYDGNECGSRGSEGTKVLNVVSTPLFMNFFIMCIHCVNKDKVLYKTGLCYLGGGTMYGPGRDRGCSWGFRIGASSMVDACVVSRFTSGMRGFKGVGPAPPGGERSTIF